MILSVRLASFSPGGGTEELIASFEEEDEDPGDEFWFEREILVDVCCR